MIDQTIFVTIKRESIRHNPPPSQPQGGIPGMTYTFSLPHEGPDWFEHSNIVLIGTATYDFGGVPTFTYTYKAFLIGLDVLSQIVLIPGANLIETTHEATPAHFLQTHQKYVYDYDYPDLTCHACETTHPLSTYQQEQDAQGNGPLYVCSVCDHANNFAIQYETISDALASMKP